MATLKFPKTIGPQFTNKIMPWFETFWHNHGRYPTESEIIQRYRITPLQVQQLNASDYWKKALERRGIRFEESPHLSPEQVAAIALITNFSDKRSPDAKLASIGVSPEQLNGWYSDVAFKRELERRTDAALLTSHPEIQAALIKQASRGNIPAIKMYYEVTGKAQTPETLNLRRALQVTLEAIQKHIKDPEILTAIAAEIQIANGLGSSPVAGAEPRKELINGNVHN